MLKELCSTQKIYCNKRAEGTSLGAATIAFENINGCRFDNPCKEIIGKTSNKMKVEKFLYHKDLGDITMQMLKKMSL